MLAFVTDPTGSARLIEKRRAAGVDLHDEVWEGVYVMTPAPNDEHQDIVGGMTHLLRETIDNCDLGKSRPGVNLSDRVDDWEHNYRCPDIVVFLNDTAAEYHDTFWFGGPDFAIEIISPNDQTREKISFYEKIGTRELLVVDRAPWQLELYRLHDGKLTLVDTSTVRDSARLGSHVLPLTFCLTAGEHRPRIEVRHSDNERIWNV